MELRAYIEKNMKRSDGVYTSTEINKAITEFYKLDIPEKIHLKLNELLEADIVRKFGNYNHLFTV